MMDFYSRILGVEFPWVKYSQMTGRDYISGAMENTTATLHTSALQQDARQLADGNKYEDYVAHELFHQWFGDLATAESWSNLTLNESFANFSETLWAEYKHGKDAAAATNYHDVEKYLADPSNPSKDLVRFYYDDRESMFDMVSYSKGGRILNMLKNYVGDSAFFKALNLYLTTYKFRNAEATDLRRAFEDVTGKDLNWYWNQWYFGSGHPIFDITYQYNDTSKKALVLIRQTQHTGKIFRIPLAIDVYEGGKKTRHSVWLEKETDSFSFPYTRKPDLIRVDGDNIVLCQKEDHKTLENFVYQYKYAGLYLDRREAIEYCAAHQDEAGALDLLKTAMKDPYWDLRSLTISSLNFEKPNVKTAFEPLLYDVASHDPERTVQARAIEALGAYKKEQYKDFFATKTRDSSYSVAGNALGALSLIDEAQAEQLADEFTKYPAKGDLRATMLTLFIKSGDTTKFDFVIQGFDDQPMSQEKFNEFPEFAALMLKMKNTEQFKRAVDALVRFRETLPTGQKEELSKLINNNFMRPIGDRKKAGGFKDQADYIYSMIQ